MKAISQSEDMKINLSQHFITKIAPEWGSTDLQFKKGTYSGEKNGL
jgi:hypothetical protein